MAIDLANFEQKTLEAVQAFWINRYKAVEKQMELGIKDQGERSGVTAGKNMDGFASLLCDLVTSNGLPETSICRNKTLATLPGYFRPTKVWDIIIVHQNRLVAAIELKSQAGPSFGNNFNNRTEEAIGSAQDLWTAYREGAFGQQHRPFVGWMMLVEDDEASRRQVLDRSFHFPIFTEFQGASYLKRYDILCQRLVLEQLYTAACIMATPRSALVTGEYSDLSEMTSLKSFLISFAGHIAVEAAR